MNFYPKKMVSIFKLKDHRKLFFRQPAKTNTEVRFHDYFRLASNWSDDFYAATEASRNRWRAACLYLLMPLSFLLLMCVAMLIPIQHIAPLLVNHYENGLVSVVPLKQIAAPINQAEVESEMVRYVVNRESYSPASYDEQYSLVNLLSNNEVAKQYVSAQNADNKSSPVNVLGNQGYRTVHVENVIFLDRVDPKNTSKDKTQHHNLAQVNFTITNHQKNTESKTTVPLTALIAWDYRETPSNPDSRWRNWDGFTVTHYTLQQRNI